MSDEFDLLLDEWTRGLSHPENIVMVFNRIRDIPYAILPDQLDPFLGPLNLLRAGRGSCVPKHFLLGILFERLGTAVRYVSIPFSWDQPGIMYPESLRTLASSLPPSYHLACRAYLGRRWVLVDCTWDYPLAAAGFPVNMHWDGISETMPAVTPLPLIPPGGLEDTPVTEIMHRSSGERTTFYGEMRDIYTPGQVEARKEFDREFNMWLDEVRRRNPVAAYG